MRKNLFHCPRMMRGSRGVWGQKLDWMTYLPWKGGLGGTVEEERGTRYSARGDEDAPRAGVTEVDTGRERMTPRNCTLENGYQGTFYVMWVIAM